MLLSFSNGDSPTELSKKLGKEVDLVTELQ